MLHYHSSPSIWATPLPRPSYEHAITRLSVLESADEASSPHRARVSRGTFPRTLTRFLIGAIGRVVLADLLARGDVVSSSLAGAKTDPRSCSTAKCPSVHGLA